MEFHAKYEQMEELGKGTYGTVFKVRDKSDGTIYAAKLVTKISIPELDIMSKFECENLVHAKEIIYDIDRESAYIIMPYIENNLQHMIQRGRPLSGTEQKMIMFQIANGLNALHNQYIHCDLKPDNILVKDDLTTYIADFSLAVSNTIPNNDSICAVKQYRPPEFLFGQEKYVKPVNDIWAYGCIVYFIVTGAHFVKDESDMKEYEKDPDMYLRKSISSDEIVRFLHRILAYAPEDRYQSFADILTDPIFSFVTARPVCTVKDTDKTFKKITLDETLFNAIIELILTSTKYGMRVQTFLFAVDLLSRTSIPADQAALTCLAIATELYEPYYIRHTFRNGNNTTRIRILSELTENIGQRTLYDYAKNLDHLKHIILRTISKEDDKIFRQTAGTIRKLTRKRCSPFEYTTNYDGLKAELQSQLVPITTIDTYKMPFIFAGF